MVSFAAPGGSVGPHRDNYDVFLCQGQGTREWRLAPPEAATPCDVNGELALLKPFAGDPEILAGPADVLYLPPGIPHWGIAAEACMTYSIGMRAPQQAEFSCACDHLFPGSSAARSATVAASTFYRDPDLTADESVPGMISENALRRARAQFASAADLGHRQLATVFGCLVTDLKAWLAPERVRPGMSRTIVRNLPADQPFSMHGMARVAFLTSNGSAQVFANGFHRDVDAGLIDQIAILCRERAHSVERLASWRSEPLLRELMEWLVNCGTYDVDDG
jgi:50S ribosomal protein L16 3-hydroxylase